MSDELSKLSPKVQERLLRLQQLQQTLNSVLGQKQQVELEQRETDQTLSELQKTADNAVIYKAIGSILVKAEKVKVNKDLVERKELLGTRGKVLERQENRIRSQIKDIQTKLQEDLSPISSPS